MTTGSGLLTDGLMNADAISIPLETEDSMRLIWIKSRSTKLSHEAHLFLDHLKKSVLDSQAYTEQVRRQAIEEHAEKKEES